MFAGRKRRRVEHDGSHTVSHSPSSGRIHHERTMQMLEDAIRQVTLNIYFHNRRSHGGYLWNLGSSPNNAHFVAMKRDPVTISENHPVSIILRSPL